METANQYGINLANIYASASALKSAQQEREYKNALMERSKKEGERQDKEYEAEQNILKEKFPGTKAATLSQAKEEYALTEAERKRKIAEAQMANEKHSKAAIAIANMPIDKQQEAISGYIATMTPEEQASMKTQFPNGVTPQELPILINKGIENEKLFQAYMKEQEMKTKHGYDLEIEGVKQKNVLTKQEREQEFRRGENRYIQGAATGRARMQAEHADERARYRVDNPPPARPLDPLHRERFEYQKQKDAEGVRKQRIKNAEDMSDLMPNYSELSGKEQKEAKQFYIKHGKLPAVTAEEGKVYGTNYKLKRSSPKKAQATDPLGIR